MTNIKLRNAGVVLALSALIFGSCSDKFAPEDGALSTLASTNALSAADSAAYLSNLIAYKESDHKKAVGYFKHNNTGNIGDLTLVPDSVDVVNLFGGLTSDATLAATHRAGISHLQQRGTKVVITYFLKWDGGPTETDLQNIDRFNSYINSLVAPLTTWNLDGIDIDLETGLIYSAATTARIINALSQYVGPASGTDKLFIFDTNMTASSLASTAGVSTAMLQLADYIYIQDYFGSTSSSNSKIDGYISNGYPTSNIMLIAADFEANYTSTSTSTGPLRLEAYYTNSTFANKVGGFGTFVMGNDAPNYPYYTELINYFNPVGN